MLADSWRQYLTHFKQERVLSLRDALQDISCVRMKMAVRSTGELDGKSRSQGAELDWNGWHLVSCGERFHPNAMEHLRQPSHPPEIHHQQIIPSCFVFRITKGLLGILKHRRRMLYSTAKSYQLCARALSAPRGTDSRCNMGCIKCSKVRHMEDDLSRWIP